MIRRTRKPVSMQARRFEASSSEMNETNAKNAM
jgi:hypothetical protein